MMLSNTRNRVPARRQRQQGVVLYVALVVMIAMMLAGIAMLRSVGTGVAVAGNLAFKQNASLAGDRGAEAAVTWLVTPGLDLKVDNAALGYSATWATGFDPQTFDWGATAPSLQAQEVTADDGAGNRVRYVVHRMCRANGGTQAGPAQECAVYGTVVTDPTSGLPIGAPPRPLFRVTSRVDGPRNTVSYIQVMVY